MTRCAVCGTTLPGGSLCPRCNSLPTELPPLEAAAPRARTPPPLLSSSAADFAPGELFAERYRIVALLGRGGMGEVYRADDLRLGQTVALKFLPAALTGDPGRLERFYAEVRLAREVSHPNVCRVYDVGEAGGRSYLAMEYVDGEDLASLLRRIGRLPEDKAVEVARQLCAGLAAVHDRGVLHRDLKPANVMLDGHGRVRLTDFGLAAAAAEAKGSDLSGTPQYMAPEQFALRPPSVRSDLYALGLVLYELFTGKPAVAGATFEELRRRHQQDPPTPPSRVRPGLDPAVERVILRCLEKEPQSRPASALEVAAALPGGDPLAAALAAGETPSPEMVAAAGAEGALRPATALACLAGVGVGLLCLALIGSTYSLGGRVGAEIKPPEVLAERARGIVAAAGYPDAPADRGYGFDVSQERRRWLREQQRGGPARRALAAVAPPILQFWYRQSPGPLVPVTFFGAQNTPFPVVSPFDPPPLEPGMVSLLLDPEGRLLAFTAVPAKVLAAGAPAAGPRWEALFAAAGLDRTRFRPVSPRRTPPVFADAHPAWAGVLPGQPPVPIRVEAAALHGRPVHFEILGPWSLAPTTDEAPSRGERAAQILLATIFLGLIVGPALAARRNLRLGRGDRRGAFRVAACVVAFFFASWAVGGKHVPALAELGLFVMTLSWAVPVAGWVWLLYLAIEPYLRRRWPHTLVSWNRLLAGRWRDPLVGRDILLGVLVTVAVLVFIRVIGALGDWIEGTRYLPAEPSAALNGTANVLSDVLRAPIAGFLFAFSLFFIFSLLRSLARRDLVAAGLFVLLLVAKDTLPSYTPVVSGAIAIVFYVSIVALARGPGLLALAAFALPVPLVSLVLTPDPDVWYAEAGFIAALVCLALAGYGAWVARAGQPLFRGDLLER